MVITNARIKILKLLLANPTQEYTIRGISLETKVNYRLVHQEVIKLEKIELITVKKIGASKVCKINLSYDLSLFSYIESLRKNELLKKHVSLIVINTELDKIKSKYFTCILFGSYVTGKIKKTSDIDLLFIIPNNTKVEQFEYEIESLFQTFNYKMDINVITENSVNELKQKSGLNVLNETIKNHIVLYGTEQYYNLIK